MIKKEKVEKNKGKLEVRPPIVVMLGHVDHGKSSLLEAIKDFKITAKESGGITQHIAAYQIEEKGKKITFIDTPGHQAFSQMRSRGARVADIAILVVDTVEGVKSQTKEVISHIKESVIPTIVALNKIDKAEADPEKVKRQLEKEGLLVESVGGEIPSVEISAITKKGIVELLDLILILAEMGELKADFECSAEGVVIESCLDNLRGPTATLLLRNGSLKKGDVIGTESTFTKVKKIENFKRQEIKRAYPSDPVIIFGFNQAPKVGEKFKVFSDQEHALANIGCGPDLVCNASKNNQEGNGKAVCLILKADVLGSLEALEGILDSLPREKVFLRIIKSEMGNVGESDIKLAVGSRAPIFAFRVKTDNIAKKIAEREKIKIKNFDVIYDLVESVKKLMEDKIELEEVRTDLGKVKVLAKFMMGKNRQIIGGKVIEGTVKRGVLIDVCRMIENQEEKIGTGKMINLQKNKKDVEEVKKKDECGILFEGVKVEEGDILSFYSKEKIKGSL
jgi:translation initiation factor IF-2